MGFMAGFLGALFTTILGDGYLRALACSNGITERLENVETNPQPILLRLHEGCYLDNGETLARTKSAGFFFGDTYLSDFIRCSEGPKEYDLYSNEITKSLYTVEDYPKAIQLMTRLSKILDLTLVTGCELVGSTTKVLCENQNKPKEVDIDGTKFIHLQAALKSKDSTVINVLKANSIANKLVKGIERNRGEVDSILSELTELRSKGDLAQNEQRARKEAEINTRQNEYDGVKAMLHSLALVERAIGADSAITTEHNKFKNGTGTFDIAFCNSSKTKDLPDSQKFLGLSEDELTRICGSIFSQVGITIGRARFAVVRNDLYEDSDVIDGFIVDISGEQISKFRDLSTEAKALLKGHFDNLINGKQPESATKGKAAELVLA